MFDMRPYRNNNDRRNNLSAYNPFREMDAFERNFFNDPFGISSFKTPLAEVAFMWSASTLLRSN